VFGQCKILFIGYCHEDLIRTYLGRGLRVDSRWILTDNPDGDLYKRLKISFVTSAGGLASATW
jgi:hypothetical protein